MVLSLRSRHATLLRPRQVSPATTPTGTDTAGTATERPVPAGTMPIRLITNGFWPAAVLAERTTTGSLPSVANDGSGGGTTQTLGRSMGRVEGEGRRGGGIGKDEAADCFCLAEGRGDTSAALAVGVDSAAFMAREISEIFDSVSVALNTADSAQYEEVGMLAVGRSCRQAHFSRRTAALENHRPPWPSIVCPVLPLTEVDHESGLKSSPHTRRLGRRK